MNRAKSFGFENIPRNSAKIIFCEGKANNAESDKNTTTNIEYFTDDLSFKCVWQESESQMRAINEFMDEIDINEIQKYADHTPSNISELLSAISSSFPSGSIENMEIAEELYRPLTSTPYLDNSNYSASENMSFSEFNDASPILFMSRKRGIFIRRCRLNFDDSLDVGQKMQAAKAFEKR